MKRVLGDAIERVEAVPGGFYVRPAIVEVDAQEGTVLQETFAPILYVLRYRDLDEAIALNNAVPQGLSLVDLHQRPARGRAVPVGGRVRLRHRQRQHRPVGRRDRRRVRRREGNRRRARKRLGQLARLHAAPDQHHQLRRQTCRSPRASASTSPHRASLLVGDHRRPARRRNSCFHGLELVAARAAARSDSPGRRRSRARAPAAAARPSRLPRRSRSGRGRGRGR